MTRWAGHTGAHLLHTYARHALALCALGRGDYQTAYDNASAITAPGTFPVNVAHALWLAFDLVEAAVRSNKPAAARAHVRAMQVTGISELSPRLRLVVAASEAMAAPAQECAALFDLALALPEARRWPFEHARLQLMYGERLRRVRAIGQARTQLALCPGDVSIPGRRPVGDTCRSRAARGRSDRRSAGGRGPDGVDSAGKSGRRPCRVGNEQQADRRAAGDNTTHGERTPAADLSRNSASTPAPRYAQRSPGSPSPRPTDGRRDHLPRRPVRDRRARRPNST